MSRGFTLVEVVIALVILQMGVLGVAGTVLLAVRTWGEAERLERTLLEGVRIVDSLRVHGASSAGERAFPGGVASWTASGGLGWTWVTVRSSAGDTVLHSGLDVP